MRRRRRRRQRIRARRRPPRARRDAGSRGRSHRTPTPKATQSQTSDRASPPIPLPPTTTKPGIKPRASHAVPGAVRNIGSADKYHVSHSTSVSPRSSLGGRCPPTSHAGSGCNRTCASESAQASQIGWTLIVAAQHKRLLLEQLRPLQLSDSEVTRRASRGGSAPSAGLPSASRRPPAPPTTASARARRRAAPGSRSGCRGSRAGRGRRRRRATRRQLRRAARRRRPRRR